MTQRPKSILGLSYGHGDSSAALIVEGELIAACEEERFNRIKHFAGYPTQSVEYCLREAGLQSSEIEVIAIAKKPLNQIFHRFKLSLTQPQLLLEKLRTKEKASGSFSEWVSSQGLSQAKIKSFEHHYAHLMSARYLPDEPETGRPLALLSFDGLGDFVSTAIGKSTPEGAKILNRVVYPHSLGFFYTAMTQYLGFPYFGDEFKVMGLSSLGEPTFISQMKSLVKTDESFGFRLNLEAFPILKKSHAFSLKGEQPFVEALFNSNYLTTILGVPPRKPKEALSKNHYDLAKSVQLRFEEVANHLLNQLALRVDTDVLALAGGCAHNSVWVGKIPQNSPFKKVFVAPASHDAGIAVGAALAAFGARVKPARALRGSWALLGPKPQWKNPGENSSELFEISGMTSESVISFLAEEISKGKIIGVAQGRLEFGPRALGNRSILADPRKAEMKEILNARVKHRESFRPFAASVLEDHQTDWFDNVFHAPTMEAVFQVKEKQKEKIAGVVHADGSCRIQSVNKEQQPFYWGLIEAFRKMTGIPMLINTSFNDSEPIVLSAEDAVRCFLNTEMDYLYVDGHLFSKQEHQKSLTA